MEAQVLLPDVVLASEGPIAAVCALLDPEDLGQLACIAKWHCAEKDCENLWRTYFLVRWSAEYGATGQTSVRVLRSWSDDLLPAPWPLAVSFCRASTALDHLFWFLPMARYALRAAETAPQLALQRPALAWHAACHARSCDDGASRVSRCLVCDTLEVMPAGARPPHFSTRWARPCACSPLVAHRECLEPQFRIIRRNGAASAAKKVLTCGVCGNAFKPALRFPETLSELLEATALEWRWALRRMMILLALFAWMRTLFAHYSGNGVLQELWPVLLFMAALISIPITERFRVSVKKIWHTPHRKRFFLLFAFFALQTYAVTLRALEPQHWEFLADTTPLLRALHRCHADLYASRLGTMMFCALSVLYATTASGVIFLFWKTSLRVPTVADAEQLCPARGGLSPARSSTPTGAVGDLLDDASLLSPRRHCEDCGLCQLGLCLDNTCM